jgi:hypothetical protein
MATRSTIAMEQPCGKVMQIYAHWDGYIDHNGKILQEHYKDKAKVYALMLLGSISSLRSEIGQAHDFDAHYDNSDPRKQWTVAYGRDRGERDTDARVFKDFKDYTDNHQYEEYEYIYRNDGNWYVSSYSGPYVLLVDAIEAEEAEREAEDA